TIHRDTGPEHAGIVFTKGAPDVLLARCEFEVFGEGRRPLTATRRDEILKVNEALAGEAMRTLGVAARWLEEDALAEHAARPDERVDRGPACAGRIGMIHPPRPAATHAVPRASS